jgi:hypothetical protein
VASELAEDRLHREQYAVTALRRLAADLMRRP